MKSVLIISVVTFFLIFGGLAVLSGQLGGFKIHRDSSPTADPTPVTALDADLVLKGLEAERSLIKQEREKLATLRQTVAVQEVVLQEGRAELAAILEKMEAQHQVRDAASERAAVRLAKMYENMKPAQAAPILSGLEMDIVLDIMQRMKEREAARILARMDASLAARISTELSQGGSS